MMLNKHPSHFITEINETLEIDIISTKDNLNFITSSADGTFTFCPRHFYQLYTFHGIKNGLFVPCTFALLPDKKEKAYIKLL